MAISQQAISISQDLLLSFKMNQPTQEYEQQLAAITFEELNNQLNSDLKKQAFWVNIYITYSQKLIQDNPDCGSKCKNKKHITIANRVFSLNDILYKILLESKSKVTGLQKIIVPKWEKALRVNYPDGRVLLAMDSHEKISDALSYYEPEKMDAQLDEVSILFLNTFIHYDLDRNEVFIPSWIKHFKREFGYKEGMISGLKRAEVIGNDMKDTKIIYSDKIASFK